MTNSAIKCWWLMSFLIVIRRLIDSVASVGNRHETPFNVPWHLKKWMNLHFRIYFDMTVIVRHLVNKSPILNVVLNCNLNLVRITECWRKIFKYKNLLKGYDYLKIEFPKLSIFSNFLCTNLSLKTVKQNKHRKFAAFPKWK